MTIRNTIHWLLFGFQLRAASGALEEIEASRASIDRIIASKQNNLAKYEMQLDDLKVEKV